MGIPTQHDRTSSENRWIDKHINNSTEGQLDLVGIRQATERGYAECVIGGVADFSYPESQTRRGRVQGGKR